MIPKNRQKAENEKMKNYNLQQKNIKNRQLHIIILLFY